jgi:lipoprotein-anchoring transpeptidase ErfK/SrfK
MSRRLIAVLALTITVLLVGAGTLYAFDREVRTRIADGVTVNGIDVGGLTPQRAQAKLRASLLDPLSRPVSVRYKGRRFTLTSEQASVAVDIEGSVDRAMAASTDGSIFTRTWREVRGTKLDTEVEAKIRYSEEAVGRIVDRIERKLEIEPRDAAVDLESGSVDPTPSRDGLDVRAAALRKSIRSELLDMGDKRIARVKTRVVEPQVTTDELAEKYPAIIIVDRGAFKLTVYKNLELHKTYRIAVGQAGYDTPTGLYNIQNKAVNPSWHVPNSDWAGDLAGTVVPPGPSNPIKARWMGIYDGAGIHGTDATGSIGTNASHGCIRMLIPDVVELYEQVPVGAPVYIA